jgi:predicted metal-dependent hydrolase
MYSAAKPINQDRVLSLVSISVADLPYITPQAHVDTKQLVSEVAEYKGAHRVLRNFRDFSALPGRGRYFMKLEALFRLSALVDYSDFE